MRRAVLCQQSKRPARPEFDPRQGGGVVALGEVGLELCREPVGHRLGGERDLGLEVAPRGVDHMPAQRERGEGERAGDGKGGEHAGRAQRRGQPARQGGQAERRERRERPGGHGGCSGSLFEVRARRTARRNRPCVRIFLAF